MSAQNPSGILEYRRARLTGASALTRSSRNKSLIDLMVTPTRLLRKGALRVGKHLSLPRKKPVLTSKLRWYNLESGVCHVSCLGVIASSDLTPASARCFELSQTVHSFFRQSWQRDHGSVRERNENLAAPSRVPVVERTAPLQRATA